MPSQFAFLFHVGYKSPRRQAPDFKLLQYISGSQVAVVNIFLLHQLIGSFFEGRYVVADVGAFYQPLMIGQLARVFTRGATVNSVMLTFSSRAAVSRAYSTSSPITCSPKAEMKCLMRPVTRMR